MFNHNKASAMSLSELDARLGLKIQEEHDGNRRLSDDTESVDVIAETHDWTWASKPV